LSAAALVITICPGSVDTGMRIDRLLTTRLWLPQPNDPASGPYADHGKRVVLMRTILDHLTRSGDIDAAGITTALPATNDSGTASFALEGWAPDRRDLAGHGLRRRLRPVPPVLRRMLATGRPSSASSWSRSATVERSGASPSS
jgi:hypothetical protein